jgi:hypothetical protein
MGFNSGFKGLKVKLGFSRVALDFWLAFLRYELPGRFRVRFSAGAEIFLLATASGPHQPLLQWSFALGVRRPERQAYHLPLSDAERQERKELYLHNPHIT